MSRLESNILTDGGVGSVERDDIERANVVVLQEGGVQAWFTVAGSFLIYLASFGIINSFGFFQTYYQLNYLANYSPSVIAFIGTLQLTLMYLLGPVVGSLFDSFGLKYLYPVAALGCSGSLLALSFSKPNQIWQQFLTQGILFGLSVSFGVRPAISIIGQYFKRRQALAMGIVAGGSSIGGVCFPIMFSKLIPLVGFGWSVRIAALVSLCCYAVGICMSRSKLPRRPIVSVGELFNYRGFSDIRYSTLCTGTFLASLGLYLPYYYIEPYAATLNDNTQINGYLLPLLNGAGFFGRILGGYIADRFGRLNILYPMTILTGVSCLVLWLPAQNLDLIIVFVCLYGFCSGVFISVTPAAIGQITPEEVLGARQGAFSSFTAISVFIGTPIGGALIKGEDRNGYQSLIIFAGCTSIGGGLVLLASRVMYSKKLGEKW